ncbi:hypothetical protein [Luteibacter aegosomatissinici]|uniref:hypothetical protein n=1 Tax=Luteibacter aegosomatissinici TaxID=2911539 RepID=UPI001FF76B72|nr:hypothetical protein [Luteibacter aegosomatissinici]UPG95621.1 hypothetical protein L2Y97_05785 [Luteibacter aegosomatissinici]
MNRSIRIRKAAWPLAIHALGLGIAMGVAAPAFALTIPGHAPFGGLPECRHATWKDACLISVPNGDFGGPEGDSHSHGYSFPSFAPPHSVAEHITPWRYIDPGRRGGGQAQAGEQFVLLQSGDGVEQRVTLPSTGSGEPVVYGVHAHVGTWTGSTRVRMDVALRSGDKVVAQANRAVQVAQVTDDPRSELMAWIEAPRGQDMSAMDIRITAEDGLGRTPVADVVIVRATPDDPLPEVTPRW